MDTAHSPIESLTVNSVGAEIRVRVVRLWDSINLKSNDIFGFYMQLLDNKGGEIHAVVGPRFLSLFLDKLTEGMIYGIDETFSEVQPMDAISTNGRSSSAFEDNLKGFILAVASSAFIGASFIFKKKGLKRAGSTGARAGQGGYGYLLEPLWWTGMITMIVGEIANFVAYIFAPAVLVTPLGALSIIVSAVLAHFILKEKLQRMGVLGCVLCIVGSTVIVLHAPEERTPSSVQQIWELATQPAFLIYSTAAIVLSLILMLHCSPRYGTKNIMVYLGICSLIGSLTVMSIKAIGIAIKLTIEGINQVSYLQTWIFVAVAISCIITQLIYLNKALDTFHTALVSPIYYAMFTTLTILASAIMFKDYSGQSASSIASEMCGFITILSGTTVLHSTRESDPPSNTDYTPLPPKIYWHVQGSGEVGKGREDDMLTPDFVTVVQQDYFI